MNRLRLFWLGSFLLSCCVAYGSPPNAVAGGQTSFRYLYVTCPADARLDVIRNVGVKRTEVADEIKVTWTTSRPPGVWEMEDPFLAEMVVLVEEPSGKIRRKTTALAAREVLFQGVPLTTRVKVSVSVASRDHLISDIVEQEFTTGLSPPSFSSHFFVHAPGRQLGEQEIPESSFYFLGFNHSFDNWYVNSGQTNPKTPKFRVGLCHRGDVDPEAAGFAHYRIRVTDADGSVIPGFDAATVSRGDTYSGRVFVIGTGQLPWIDAAQTCEGNTALLGNCVDETGWPNSQNVTNLSRLHHHSDRPIWSYFESPLPFWERYYIGDSFVAQRRPQVFAPATGISQQRLSANNLLALEGLGHVRSLYALPPDETYDFPADFLPREGLYTFTAWAEDGNNQRISPPSSVVAMALVTRKGQLNSNLAGHEDGTNRYVPAAHSSHDGMILRLSIRSDQPAASSCTGHLRPDERAGLTDSRDEARQGELGPDVPGICKDDTDAGALTLSQEVNEGLVRDCAYLLEGKNLLEGKSPLEGESELNRDGGTLNWDANVDIDSWIGVGLGGTPERVTTLNFQRFTVSPTLSRNQSLDGEIPPVFGRLSALQHLVFAFTGITGYLPEELRHLSKLRSLLIVKESKFNLEKAGIPHWIGFLTSLENLRLQQIRLSGGLPDEMKGLSNLRVLNLVGNGLTGPVPTWLEGLSAMEELNLDSNIFSGSIPSSLGKLSSLEVLVLSNNKLSGSIPREIFLLKKLKRLILNNNKLSSNLSYITSDFWGDSSRPPLEFLYLEINSLSGPIPAALGQLTSLTRLRLHSNDFSGPIPAALGQLTSLTRLRLNANKLSGSIPAALGDLTKLTHLFLADNSFDTDSCLPKAIRNLASLVSHDFLPLNLPDCP